MIISTALTDEQFDELIIEYNSPILNLAPSRNLLRAVEQAVLHSPQVQEWKKDSDRINWLEVGGEMHGFFHLGWGEYAFYSGMGRSIREVIDNVKEGE